MISFWEKQWFSKADFTIIGAGIVGLQCATAIKKKFPHREVWILDRAPLSFGASTRNAGFACFGSLGEILDDEKNMGLENALNLYAMRYKGLHELLNHCGKEKTGYEPTGGVEIFTREQEPELAYIKTRIDEINACLKPINNLDQTFQLKNSSKMEMNIHSEMIFSPAEGAVQTHLLYQSLYRKAIETGVKIYGGIKVESVAKQLNNKWLINAGNQFSIETRNLVVCTNGFTRLLFENMEVNPARGQVMVTSPIPGLAWRGIVHADKGYTYFRSLGTRILIGGGRNKDFAGEETYEMKTTEMITDYLKNYLTEIVIPGISFEITDQWSGIMGMNTNRLPIVEKKEDGLYFCVKMGGMGVALSALVSRQLCHLIEG